VTLAFGGGPLRGDKIVRLVYLDEAGISNPAHEPWLVVAGIVINADKQFKLIESYLDELVKKHIPQEKRAGFSFHAMELFHGNKSFDRNIWPLEKRLEILDDLVAIPKMFDIPICFGSIPRVLFRWQREKEKPGEKPARIEQRAHAEAFFKCVIQTELVMRAIAQDEVAMLIAEDREPVRKMLKLLQSIITGRPPQQYKHALSDPTFAPDLKFLMPLQRIIETVHFAQKVESSLLQVADICAFAIKREFTKAPHAERLYGPLHEHVVFRSEAVAAVLASAGPGSR
jgi:hypothetical protein